MMTNRESATKHFLDGFLVNLVAVFAQTPSWIQT